MNKEFCSYCGEEIKERTENTSIDGDFKVNVDNDSVQEPCHMGCALEMGVSFITDSGVHSDDIEETKREYGCTDLYEALEMHENDSFPDNDEDEGQDEE
jgi:hypothetical protein